MDFEILTHERAFWNLRAAWNALNRESLRPNLTGSHEWIWTWWKAFGSSGTLWILVAKENGKITGIAPFMKTRIFKYGTRLRTIQFLANAHSNKAGFLVAGNAGHFFDELANFLYERRAEFDFLNFMLLPEHDPFVKMVKFRQTADHFFWGIRPGTASPVVRLEPEFDAYLSKLSKKSRYNVRKKRREIEKLDGFRIRHYEDADEAEKFLACVEQIERKSWKFKEGRSLLSKEEVWNFYRAVISEMAQNQVFHGFILFLQNKPAAYEMAFASGEDLLSQKISYDEQWRAYSPGFVLKTEVIRWACETGFRTNHLLGDCEPWKLQLGGVLNPHVYVQAYRPGLHRTVLAKWEFDWVHKLGSAKRTILKVGSLS
ncbi:MAG: GNAT family N-acetyltransferase [Calditrichaeota bacterium]|nr:GNAT family N-acetyltransferase [Calditrichota bacterium]